MPRSTAWWRRKRKHWLPMLRAFRQPHLSTTAEIAILPILNLDGEPQLKTVFDRF
jgi:hypothetical protein